MLVEGSGIYTGQVFQGFLHGTGIVSFSGKPHAQITMTFYKGEVQQNSSGKILLRGGIAPILVDVFREEWGFTHTAHAELTSQNAHYIWNGQKLVASKLGKRADVGESWSIEAGKVTASDKVTNETAIEVIEESKEVYELLDALRWFEFHFIKSQMMLASEVYLFDTPEQQQKEKEKHKQQQEELKEREEKIKSEL